MDSERTKEEEEPISPQNRLFFHKRLRCSTIILRFDETCTQDLFDPLFTSCRFQFFEKGSSHIVETLKLCTAPSIDYEALWLLDFSVDEHLIEVVELDA